MSIFDEPQSRSEAILQNMLGASNVLTEPESRLEELLTAILESGGGGGGGGDYSYIVEELKNKVDKVTGKGLSTNDYTNAEKTKLENLSNYDDTALTSALADKVDKVTGKGLSTNDYTNAEKTKLQEIERGAKVNVQSDYSQTDSTADDYIKHKPTFSTVATTGDYDDLINKPEIPFYENKIEIQDGTSLSLVTQGEKYIWNHKQDTLIFDNAPIENSNNLLTSGAIFHALSLIGGLQLDVVEQLPTSNIDSNKIYLVQSQSSQNTYDEYVYINEDWERIGNTEVDLSGYLHSTDVDSTLSSNSANPIANSTVYNALADKVDKVTGKGLSTNDYTNAEKTKLENLSNYDDTALTSALADKVDKVTGKGLSTNDYTNAEKTKLENLSNYDDTALTSALADKVDKVAGKGLSTNDYTNADKEIVSNIASENTRISLLESYVPNGTTSSNKLVSRNELNVSNPKEITRFTDASLLEKLFTDSQNLSIFDFAIGNSDLTCGGATFPQYTAWHVYKDTLGSAVFGGVGYSYNGNALYKINGSLQNSGVLSLTITTK